MPVDLERDAMMRRSNREAETDHRSESITGCGEPNA
jgi:hypothetical protein